jgi:hypothetical protein
MATPSAKERNLTNFLETVNGRTTAIEADVCIREPMGCGGPAVEFSDALSKKEYTISGFCQACQDKIFGG